MPEEKPAPLPLSGDEVKEAILFRVQESLNKHCALMHDNAYTSFTADISIRLKLSDYGREVVDNHFVRAEETSGLPDTSSRLVEANVTIQPAPPNQVRVESDQPVPVLVKEGEKTKIRHIKYAPRKKSEIGR